MKYKVLIVDDSIFIRKIIGEAVSKLNCEVVGEAVDVEDAVEKFLKLKPDIVTMDIHMPSRDGKKSGVDACKAIKELNPDVKIVMVTALGHRKSVIDAIKAGANDYIVKPIDEENLIKVFTKLMNPNAAKK